MTNKSTTTNRVRTNVVKNAGYIPGEQPIDPTIIKLNTNENPYPPAPGVLEAIRSISAEQLRRYPNPSARIFRELAAKVHGVPDDCIMAFNGGDDLLSVIMRTCASEHEAIAFLEPSYSLYPVLADLQGSRIEIWHYEISGDKWRLPDKIEESNAALLLIVNPNAPSGHFEPVERLEQVIKAFRGVVLIDEAYVDFSEQSVLPLVQKYSNLVVLRTMSKGYSLAGIRFGYAIAQSGLLRELEKVRDSYPCDVISIAAATAALEAQDYARSTWKMVKEERTRLTSELKDLGFTIPESQSNFVLAKAPEGINAQRLYETLKERRILVRWWNLPNLSDKVRITVGTREQNDKLLEELRKQIATAGK
jgi:histidinol-phosphate aminotransferase